MLWYSLEVARWGASNEYHNICFFEEIRKIFTFYPLLSRPVEMNFFFVDFIDMLNLANPN